MPCCLRSPHLSPACSLLVCCGWQETLERVTYRSQLLDERAAQAEEAKKRAAEEEERRMQALQRLAAQVPYAERLAAIEADPLKPTELMKVR